MDTQTAERMSIEEIEELAEKIEDIIKERILGAEKAGNDVLRMIYEDMLLIGPTDRMTSNLSFFKTVVAGVRKTKEFACTSEEFLMAALLIRQKSLKARGLK